MGFVKMLPGSKCVVAQHGPENVEASAGETVHDDGLDVAFAFVTHPTNNHDFVQRSTETSLSRPRLLASPTEPRQVLASRP
jgi:hypothetical protein